MTWFVNRNAIGVSLLDRDAGEMVDRLNYCPFPLIFKWFWLFLNDYATLRFWLASQLGDSRKGLMSSNGVCAISTRLAEWYVRCKQKSLLKEYSLSHTVTEWNCTFIANPKVYWKNMVCPTLLLNGTCVINTKVLTKRIQFASHFCWMIHMSRAWKCTERIRFAPHCCWMVHMSRTWSFTYQNGVVVMCAAISVTQDRLQRRKKCDRLKRAQETPEEWEIRSTFRCDH